jgi:hypothetical protein
VCNDSINALLRQHRDRLAARHQAIHAIYDAIYLCTMCSIVAAMLSPSSPAMTNQSPGMAILYAFWALAVCSRASRQYIVVATLCSNPHLRQHLAGILYLGIAYWAWYRPDTRTLRIGLIIECGGVIAVAVSLYEQFGPHLPTLPPGRIGGKGYRCIHSHYLSVGLMT